jgi:hypothetical protein
MPLIIAGILYGLLAALALAVIGGVCLARRRPPGASTLGAVVGSLAGFLLGCIAGALACITFPAIGGRVGATTVAVVVSLGTALLGMAVGVAASRRARRTV